MTRNETFERDTAELFPGTLPILEAKNSKAGV